MRNLVFHSTTLACLVLVLVACDSRTTLPGTSEEEDPKLFFVRGYRYEDDPCKLTGETEFTNRFLDDAADLVTCPTIYEGTAEFIGASRAKVVTRTKSYTLYRVPRR